LFVCLSAGTKKKAAVSSRFPEYVGGLGATPVGIANLDVFEMMGVATSIFVGLRGTAAEVNDSWKHSEFDIPREAEGRRS
jgi:hypothetical protein